QDVNRDLQGNWVEQEGSMAACKPASAFLGPLASKDPFSGALVSYEPSKRRTFQKPLLLDGPRCEVGSTHSDGNGQSFRRRKGQECLCHPRWRQPHLDHCLHPTPIRRI
ncbi:unnamed protein product, partial [Ostreobium quekettii]